MQLRIETRMRTHERNPARIVAEQVGALKPSRLEGRPAPLRRVARQTPIENPWIRVHRDELHLDSGAILDHWIIDYVKTGVGIVPINHRGELLLGLHYRPTVERWGWEIPAGGALPGEDFADTARRELAEETGHSAGLLMPLGEYHPAPGLGNERFVLFLARELSEIPFADIDEHEIHEVRAFTWEEYLDALDRGDIYDGMTITAVFWWRNYLSRSAP